MPLEGVQQSSTRGEQALLACEVLAQSCVPKLGAQNNLDSTTQACGPTNNEYPLLRFNAVEQCYEWTPAGAKGYQLFRAYCVMQHARELITGAPSIYNGYVGLTLQKSWSSVGTVCSEFWAAAWRSLQLAYWSAVASLCKAVTPLGLVMGLPDTSQWFGACENALEGLISQATNFVALYSAPTALIGDSSETVLDEMAALDYKDMMFARSSMVEAWLEATAELSSSMLQLALRSIQPGQAAQWLTLLNSYTLLFTLLQNTVTEQKLWRSLMFKKLEVKSPRWLTLAYTQLRAARASQRVLSHLGISATLPSQLNLQDLEAFLHGPDLASSSTLEEDELAETLVNLETGLIDASMMDSLFVTPRGDSRHGSVSSIDSSPRQRLLSFYGSAGQKALQGAVDALCTDGSYSAPRKSLEATTAGHNVAGHNVAGHNVAGHSAPMHETAGYKTAGAPDKTPDITLLTRPSSIKVDLESLHGSLRRQGLDRLTSGLHRVSFSGPYQFSRQHSVRGSIIGGSKEVDPQIAGSVLMELCLSELARMAHAYYSHCNRMEQDPVTVQLLRQNGLGGIRCSSPASSIAFTTMESMGLGVGLRADDGGGTLETGWWVRPLTSDSVATDLVNIHRRCSLPTRIDRMYANPALLLLWPPHCLYSSMMGPQPTLHEPHFWQQAHAGLCYSYNVFMHLLRWDLKLHNVEALCSWCTVDAAQLLGSTQPVALVGQMAKLSSSKPEVFDLEDGGGQDTLLSWPVVDITVEAIGLMTEELEQRLDNTLANGLELGSHLALRRAMLIHALTLLPVVINWLSHQLMLSVKHLPEMCIIHSDCLRLLDGIKYLLKGLEEHSACLQPAWWPQQLPPCSGSVDGVRSNFRHHSSRKSRDGGGTTKRRPSLILLQDMGRAITRKGADSVANLAQTIRVAYLRANSPGAIDPETDEMHKTGLLDACGPQYNSPMDHSIKRGNVPFPSTVFRKGAGNRTIMSATTKGAVGKCNTAEIRQMQSVLLAKAASMDQMDCIMVKRLRLMQDFLDTFIGELTDMLYDCISVQVQVLWATAPNHSSLWHSHEPSSTAAPSEQIQHALEHLLWPLQKVLVQLDPRTRWPLTSLASIRCLQQAEAKVMQQSLWRRPSMGKINQFIVDVQHLRVASNLAPSGSAFLDRQGSRRDISLHSPQDPSSPLISAHGGKRAPNPEVILDEDADDFFRPSMSRALSQADSPASTNMPASPATNPAQANASTSPTGSLTKKMTRSMSMAERSYLDAANLRAFSASKKRVQLVLPDFNESESQTSASTGQAADDDSGQDSKNDKIVSEEPGQPKSNETSDLGSRRMLLKCASKRFVPEASEMALESDLKLEDMIAPALARAGNRLKKMHSSRVLGTLTFGLLGHGNK